ncbi:AcrR family transcriptional regulator [Nonomuraea thailandensis]|uniref:AcrR family transcriptional regulator n=1 Tax=Nonomuraea thailandensis TaxID=1188745 RepID=A0A9X2K1A6_9ACTN|nr:TetR/AcrR family transcriptional regulator [Nonomuraea thailandensis]MCP2353321.1 AcrR family transcriptional regulator [Nonomuraea thailandensis]
MTPTPPTDRRVRRTRTLLHTALIELISEKGYDNVTVQDILDRADVGRSTFYLHYPSKDQLLLSGMHHLQAELSARLSADAHSHESSVMAPLRPLFEHAADKRHLYRALLGSRATTVALRSGRRMLSDLLATHLHSRLNIDDRTRLDMMVAFLVNGLIGVLTWWHDTEPDLSAEQMYTSFERLAVEGLRSFESGNPK